MKKLIIQVLLGALAAAGCGREYKSEQAREPVYTVQKAPTNSTTYTIPVFRYMAGRGDSPYRIMLREARNAKKFRQAGLAEALGYTENDIVMKGLAEGEEYMLKSERVFLEANPGMSLNSVGEPPELRIGQAVNVPDLNEDGLANGKRGEQAGVMTFEGEEDPRYNIPPLKKNVTFRPKQK